MLWGVRRYFLSASLLGYSNSGELSNAKVEFGASPVERIFHRRTVVVSPFFCTFVLCAGLPSREMRRPDGDLNFRNTHTHTPFLIKRCAV